MSQMEKPVLIFFVDQIKLKGTGVSTIRDAVNHIILRVSRSQQAPNSLLDVFMLVKEHNVAIIGQTQQTVAKDFSGLYQCEFSHLQAVANVALFFYFGDLNLPAGKVGEVISAES